ncbi:CotH kinase family protein [Oscillospiraceae bacterium OttesenSCG-928-G22]|nr:CotH kinase family protein [Oscillospiraceae bacterium OttesenSCG-928-G22]
MSRAGRESLASLDDEFYLRGSFQTHLPVVVIGEGNVAGFFTEDEPLTAKAINRGTLVRGDCTVQWSEGALEGKPKREKADYSLHITGNCKTALEEKFWGEPVLDDWYLLGGMYDKSLLRNYLALTLAEEMDIAVYRVKHCEVFVEGESGYRYEGVYLLAAPAVTDSYHIQRGNYWDADSLPLDTYATRRRLVSEGLYVSSMRPVDAAEFSKMEFYVDSAEACIYSSDYNEFSKYKQYLDLTKVYDYFIVYELFGNYSAGHLPRYFYSSESHKLWPVVLADFEFAVDNEQTRPLAADDMEMIFTPYYQPLTKSYNFLDGLVRRYHLLKQDTLKNSNLAARIDRIAADLGESQERDWQRWSAMYNSLDMYDLAQTENPLGPEYPPLNRNTYFYEQEINKLKFTLRNHGDHMFSGIAELYTQDDMVGNDASYVLNAGFALLFLGVIILSVRVVRHRTR